MTSLPAASVAVLTGHVERLALFRGLLDDPQDARVDGLHSVSGTRHRTRVLVIGTGMGGPVTIAGVRQARDHGARVVVRAGGAGSIAPAVDTGHFVVATAAVRDEGASRAFLPPERPAVADPEVTRCLRRAATATATPVHTGVVHSKDAFFASEVAIEEGPQADRQRARWTAWRRLGVLASDMEVAPLFAAAEHYGMSAGAVLRINHLTEETGGLRPVESELCTVALDGAVAAYRTGDRS